MAHSPENTNLSSFKSIKRESGITKLIIFHMEECKHSDEIMVTKQKKKIIKRCLNNYLIYSKKIQ